MEAAQRLVHRHFTDDYHAPYDLFRWGERIIKQGDQTRAFVCPEHWRQEDIEILVQSFGPEENDLRQVVDRVVNPITKAGFATGYFQSEAEADIFHDELQYLLVSQKMVLSTDIWRSMGRQAVTLSPPQSEEAWHISDLFMRAVEADGEWSAQAPPDKRGKARAIWQDIVRQAWQQPRPIYFTDVTRVRYLQDIPDTIPSAELSLLSFLNENGELQLDAIKQVVRIAAVTLDILIDYIQSSPEVLRQTRPIAIGYTELAATLQSKGVSYDGDKGRRFAAFVTSYITGAAYEASIAIAARAGSYETFKKNLGRVSSQLRSFQKKVEEFPFTEAEKSTLQHVWENVLGAYKQGVRHSLVTALTDPEAIMPLRDLMLVTKLPSGGSVQIVQPSVALGLRQLGYDKMQTTEIVNHIHERGGETEEVPHLQSTDATVFRLHDNEAHLKMISVVQSFLSGRVCSPLVMATQTTLRDIERLLFDAWQNGVEYIHIQRQQNEQDQQEMEEPIMQENTQSQPIENNLTPGMPHQSQYRPLPRIRNAKTFAFTIDRVEGYFTVGEYDDGTPGELLVHISKLDTEAMVLIQTLAQTISHGLQHGVPFAVYAKTLASVRLAPHGTTDDPEVPEVSSILDYIARRMALQYLSLDERIAQGLDTEENAEKRIQDRQTKLVA